MAGNTPVLVHNCSDVISNAGHDNAATLATHGEGSVFSGVHDPATGKFRAHRSVEERGPDSGPNVVNRYGGHGQINFEHFGGSRDTVGFTIFREKGGFSINWRSRSVNVRNHSSIAAPDESREGIMAAISEATGLPVWSR